MVYKVKLEYTIKGLFKSEHTTLSALESGDKFNFGTCNERLAQVKIVDINSESVVLKISDLEKRWTILTTGMRNKNVVKLKVGESVALMSPNTPSGSYNLKILEIWEDKRLFVY